MSGAISATTVATVVASAATAAAAGYSIANAASAADPLLNATGASSEISGAAQSAQLTRSQLLATAGGSAGSILNPTQIGGNGKNTIFGN